MGSLDLGNGGPDKDAADPDGCRRAGRRCCCCLQRQYCSRHANGAINTRDDVRCRYCAGATVFSVDGCCSSSYACVALIALGFGLVGTITQMVLISSGYPPVYAVLFQQVAMLCGIVGTVVYTYRFWNPESDSALRARYTALKRAIPKARACAIPQAPPQPAGAIGSQQ